MNIKIIEEFVFLAESLSFTETAKRFYVNRSVISRHLSALELEVGAHLLDRNRRKVSLTKEGQAFYREAKVLIRDFERLLLSTRNVSDGSGQIIRVAYLRNASRACNVRFARCLQETASFFRPSFVPMEYDESLRALDERTVDVALSMDYGQPFPSGVLSLPACKDQLVVVTHEGGALDAGEGDLYLRDLYPSELLVSQSFANPTLGAFLKERLGAPSPYLALSYCSDFDGMRLRMQVEGKAALQSEGNYIAFRNDFVAKHISDVDLGFHVSVLHRDDLEPETARAVRAAAEMCLALE